MRLREIREAIAYIGDFNILKKEVNSNVTDISNISIVNERIAKLEEFRFLDDSIEKLNKNLPTIYNYRGGLLRVSNGDFEQYEEIVREIKLQINAVLNAIDLALSSPQEMNSISIKLPEYTGLKKVGTFIIDMEKILSQMLPSNLNCEIKLNTFDTGTNWIEVIVNNEEAIHFIGIVVNVSLKFAKNQLVSILKTKKSLEMSNDINLNQSTETNKVLDALIKEFASIEVDKIISEANLSEAEVGNMFEYKERLAKQMIDLSKYMAEGAEVHPALNAPENVKEEFPDAQEVKSLTHEVRTFLIEHVVEKILDEEDSEE